MIDITSIINTVKIDYTLLTIRDLVRRSATDSKAAEELAEKQRYDFAFNMHPRHPGAARERWVEHVAA